MEITSYHNNADGDICFSVKGTHFLRVLEHLRSKGLHPGGKHGSTGYDEIRVGDTSLSHLRQALSDLDELN